MSEHQVVFAAAVGMTAGAFGAHGLKNRVDAEHVRSWEAASHYAVCCSIVMCMGAEVSLMKRTALRQPCPRQAHVYRP